MSTLTFGRLPLALQEKITGLTARPVLIGESGTKVFQLSRDHTPTCYLKIATDMAPRELHIERDRLVWLRDKLPVPDVLFYGEDADTQYLLLSAVQGVDASVLAEREDGDPLLLVTALAEGLRQIHAVPIEGCPLERRLDFMLGEAWKRVERLLVDEDDFDDERQGFTAQQLYEQLQMSRPRDEELVFVHGDYCFPNILMEPDTLRITGFIDWSRGGAADRYQDLALAARSIVRNVGERWIGPFYEAYGLAKVDARKIRFYQLLDEFF